MENIVINAVPTYPNAPVGANLLKADLQGFLKQLSAKNAANAYLLVDSQNAMQIDEPGIKVVPVQAPSGFVYSNPAAAWRAVNNGADCPIDKVYTVEEIMDAASKTLFVFDSAGKSKEIQVDRQCTAAEILRQHGGADGPKAVYLGFPMAIMLDASQLEKPLEITTDYALILAEQDCILHQLAAIAQAFYSESCGRCVFGYEGLFQMQAILSDMTNKKGKIDDIALMAELGDIMKAQCLCEVGKTAANLITSAMKAFEAEITEHITKKNCKAAFCKKFITFHILKDKCVGCMECQDACEDEVIAGKKRFVHVIDQDECIQCGKCFEACEHGAIVKAGAIKPKCPPKPVPCTAS
ncbi:MAG: 4Fe-4S binding protein [Defluviitaleaceae bacterium]|nr:4Fe-4S binding protein [Defluviitaleaceae bacterium]